MDLSVLFKRAGKVAADNSPAILTAIGVTGTLTTAYLAAKGAFKAVEVLKETEEKREVEYAEKEETFVPALTTREMFDATWKCYIPAASSVALTVVAIIYSNRINDRRTAALASAYSVAEKSYAEYRAKTAEKVGKNKEQVIRDEIAQDDVTNNPPTKSEIIIVGDGPSLCRDAYSGRYFNSSVELLRKAENDINWQILNDGYASLSDFWDVIGLKHTDGSDDLGWNTDQKFDIKISGTISEDQKPCLSFSFQPSPKPRFFRNSH